MLSGKSDKKLSVMTKTVNAKKPHLEINTNPELDPGAKSGPGGFSNFAEEDLKPDLSKNVAALTSPKGFKNVP